MISYPELRSMIVKRLAAKYTGKVEALDPVTRKLMTDLIDESDLSEYEKWDLMEMLKKQ